MAFRCEGSARRKLQEDAMEDRYPYLRFVIGAAQIVAGSVAAIVLLGGTMRSCGIGGFAGFVWFLLSLVAASLAWTAVMMAIESVQVFLDIEEHTRKLAEEKASSEPSMSSGG
jgi:uncharacterized membrane protein YjjP (DUF1212 family)